MREKRREREETEKRREKKREIVKSSISIHPCSTHPSSLSLIKEKYKRLITSYAILLHRLVFDIVVFSLWSFQGFSTLISCSSDTIASMFIHNTWLSQ